MKSPKLFYSLFILTLVPIFLALVEFIPRGFFEKGDEFWVIGILVGLIGFILIWWQYILGVRQIATFLFGNDLSAINKIHQNFGKYGFLFILLHPLILVIDFNNRGFNLLSPEIKTDYDLYIFLGKIAFFLLTLIWIVSAVARRTISWRLWKRIHFFTYLILPLVFIHSLRSGTLFAIKGLEYYWHFLNIIFLIITFYRVLSQLGILKKKYAVTNIEPITHNVVRINLAPRGSFLVPEKGQFVYVQNSRMGESHPFTISHFDTLTGNLSISAKASGKFSTDLHNLKTGQQVYIDGPYGVFTKEMYQIKTPLVLVAGGVGITPFVRFFESLKTEPENFPEVILFYGNQSGADVAYKDELESLQKIKKDFKVVHIFSNENIEGVESGYINADLLKKYLQDLNNYDFFVCGPPGMLKSVYKCLIDSGVKKSKIYTEKFSF
jgi:predicted ferric reductase